MREYRKLHIAGDIPITIPRYPERDYKNEWIGIGNWLGTRYIERSKFLWRKTNERDFEQTRE